MLKKAAAPFTWNPAPFVLPPITAESVIFMGPQLTSEERLRRARAADERTYGTEQVNPLTWQIRMAELVATGQIGLLSSIEHYATHPNEPTTEGFSERLTRKTLATYDRIIALAQALPPA